MRTERKDISQELSNTIPPVPEFITLPAEGYIPVEPELLPVEETSQGYLRYGITNNGALETNLYLLRNRERELVPVPREELVASLSNPDLVPDRVQGYHNGHRGYDLGVEEWPRNEIVELAAPHSEAILFAAFEDLSTGPVAQRFESSGAITIFHLNVQTLAEPKPYFVAYAHLSTSSVREAMDQAFDYGHSQIAGRIGHTGRTDGRHFHIQVLDINSIYEISEEDNPTGALDFVLNSETQLTTSMKRDIFINPENFFTNLPRY